MRIAALAVAVVGLLATAAVPARAEAKPVSCWSTVILDWQADGTIDGSYAPRCYRQALRHLRTDLRIYSDAQSQIEQALAAASFGSGSPGGGAGSGRLALWPEGRRFAPAPPPARAPRPIDHSLNVRLDLLLARHDSSTPVPLYVLGGIALLLLGAGAAGLLAQRLRPQRP